MAQAPEIHFYSIPKDPNIESMEEGYAAAASPPPGTGFFEQALSLFKLRHEDPSIDQIEALNLIVRITVNGWPR